MDQATVKRVHLLGRDPLRALSQWCALVMVSGALLVGFGWFWHFDYSKAIESGLQADRDFLNRLNKGEVTCTGFDIRKVTVSTLAYHEDLEKLGDDLPHFCYMVGGLLLVTGISQLV